VRLVDALASLGGLEDPIFETGDAAVRLGLSNTHASATLARLAAARQLVRLRRGLWALPGRVDPLALPARLTAPLPSYVSLQSALYFHGMISQVPAITYAVSLARARRYTTPLGVVSVHHVTPGFFFGFAEAGRQGALIASPEKALVDFLYLAPARSMLFRALPELELPRGFSARRARAMTERIKAARRRVMVVRSLARILGAGSTRR
jgi:predicted transcriptional regulator of viral defense system